MSAASDYLENELLDHVLGNGAYTAPTNVYLSLHTGSPLDDDSGANEVSTSGTAYARVAVTFGTIDTQAGSVSNSANVTFTAATASFGTVTHIGITDNATAGAGNLLFHGALDASKAIDTGDTFQITTGNLTVTMA